MPEVGVLFRSRLVSVLVVFLVYEDGERVKGWERGCLSIQERYCSMASRTMTLFSKQRINSLVCGEQRQLWGCVGIVLPKNLHPRLNKDEMATLISCY